MFLKNKNENQKEEKKKKQDMQTPMEQSINSIKKHA